MPMYNLEALRRRVRKNGVDAVINDLLNNQFSEESISQMTKDHILCDGYPNLSLIYSLVWQQKTSNTPILLDWGVLFYNDIIIGSIIGFLFVFWNI